MIGTFPTSTAYSLVPAQSVATSGWVSASSCCCILPFGAWRTRCNPGRARVSYAVCGSASLERSRRSPPRASYGCSSRCCLCSTGDSIRLEHPKNTVLVHAGLRTATACTAWSCWRQGMTQSREREDVSGCGACSHLMPWSSALERGWSLHAGCSTFLGYLSCCSAAWMVLQEALCGYMTEG